MDSLLPKSKVCSKCGEEKLFEEFHKDKSKKNGLRSSCKACVSSRKNYSINPNLVGKICFRCKKNKSIDEFYKNKKNPCGLGSYCKVCHKVKTKEYITETGWKHQVTCWVFSCESRCCKCKETKSRDQFYKDKSKKNGLQSLCKSCYGKYVAQKFKTDRSFKLKYIMRSEIYQLIQIIKNKKSSNRVFKRLGCTITEFKEHIESNFVEGMSWDNYGYDTWHIDHIIPLDWFVKNSDNVFEANHYTNLRPIQAEKNMSKGDTLDMDLVKSYGIEDLLPVGVDK